MDYPKKSIKCKHCGEWIDCSSNAQKYCQPSDDPACYFERVTAKMTDKQYLNYTQGNQSTNKIKRKKPRR